MTRSKSRKPVSKKNVLKRSRQLRFDILEDRRLLAGIDVFVFDDLDGSGSYNSSRESALTDRAVYIDLDNDGKLGGSEPWTTSDIQGKASFPNITPGNYSVRMVGNNQSIIQTFPTRAADQGHWSDIASISKVLQVEADGSAWSVAGNALSRIDAVRNIVTQSISFGDSEIVDAALVRNSDGDSDGFVLTRNPDHSQSLWKVSTENDGAKQLTSVDVSSTTQLITVGSQILAGKMASSMELLLVDSEGLNGNVVLKDIGIEGLAANSTIYSTGPNSLLVSEGVGGSNRLSWYGLSGSNSQLIGKRSFASSLLSASVSSDGEFVAVSTVDDFLILRPEIGLPTLAILPDATGPVAFDPLRSLLFTGTKTSPSNLTAWSTSTWEQNQSILIANGGSLTGASLLLDGTGSQVIVSQYGAIYTQSLAIATAAVATVAGNQVVQLEIGLKSIGTNRAPQLSELETIEIHEDGLLNFDSLRIRSNSSDMDGDSLAYLVRSSPTLGLLNLNQDATGVYAPYANANGQDYVTIQVYDGRDWSVPRVLPITVNPVNDAPSGISFSTDSITENPILRSALMGISALDPDVDADYQYQVDDSRFSVEDGILRFVDGEINFEDEPIIVLAVTGTDRLHPSDTISRQITLSIRDVNEAPSGISTPSSLIQPELTEDLVLGQVFAIDQDNNDQYTWGVSDPRFEIVDGILRLKSGNVLDFEGESSIRLVIQGTDSQGEFSIEKTVTVSVTDQDDEPTGISFVGSFKIQSNTPGIAVGNTSVVDPDQGEPYSFAVNDSRFEVIRGVLKLKPGTEVGPTESGFFDLLLTATSLRSGTRVSQALRLEVVKDPTPHHNDENPYDVDGDGVLTPLDPLVVINHINDKGVGPIEEPGEGEGRLPDLDVDGDGEVTPLDILILINKLNQQNDDDAESEAEGESVELAIEPALSTPVVSAPTSILDSSLASYLSDLSDEVGPRRIRRR